MSSRILLCAVAVLTALCAMGAHAQTAGATHYTLELWTQTHGFPSETAMYTQLRAQLANMPKGPGMPDMSAALAGMASMGAPVRRVGGEAHYPGTPPEPIYVTVPTDLKLEKDRLPLEVPKPIALPEGFTGNFPGAGGAVLQPMHFEEKLYWNPVTAKGPIAKAFDVDPAKIPQGAAGRNVPSARAAAQAAQAEQVDTATGDNSQLPPDVVGQGTYTLNTGGVIALDGFLPPLNITAPENAADVVAADGFELKWEPVPGARGFILFVSQFINNPGAVQTIHWVSTTVQPPERLIWNQYHQATTIADDLRDGILMPADTTSCVVPPGMFTAGAALMINLWAIGNDTWDDTGNYLREGRIRAVWNGNTAAAAMGRGNRRTPGGMPPGFQLPAGVGGDE